MSENARDQAVSHLRQIIESIESLEAEMALTAATIEKIYADAEEAGFETEVLRQIVTLRAADARERAAAASGPKFSAEDVRLCQSPIEENLLIALYAATWPANYQPKIHPQMEYGPYRADFVVTDAAYRHSSPLIVECDGHDFHERTKEQAARDRSRDRFFTLAGFKVLRFTGSEIHRDAAKCAQEVIAVALTTVPE